MTYALAAGLQQAVYEKLANDTTLQGLVGSAVFDAPPEGGLPDFYVSLGPETVIDRSDKTEAGAVHRFTVSVVTDAASFHSAKTAAGAVTDALVDASLSLPRGRLTSLHFVRATARRGRKAARRRIDLTFRASLDDA
ncbi:MAG: DUF3168 domain-containing protein [Pseudomonadota bacterium]